MKQTTHHDVREAIRARIVSGEWGLGERIPDENAFAEQYGCARTTVNRAIRALADEGIVERKRKGGTRVRPMPLRQAQLTIPIVREQVEASGRRYDHRIVRREPRTPDSDAIGRMGLSAGGKLWWLETIHLADGRPFALEQRWVNPAVVPGFADADLSGISANEWLVRTVPFSTGTVALSAVAADGDRAGLLQVAEGDALFAMERTTWLDEQAVTTMTLYYPADFRWEFSL